MRGEHRKFQRQEAHESKRYKSDDILSLPDKIPGLIEALVNEIVQWKKTTAIETNEYYQTYNAGVFAGLESVIEKVKLLVALTTDPARLLSELRMLAQSVEEDYQSIQKQINNPFVEFKQNNKSAVIDAGRGEGFRKVSYVLRWFLGEN